MCRIDPARWSLTPRETTVADALARGLSLSEIAGALGLRYSHVKKTAFLVERKMGVRSMAEVAILLHGGVPASLADAPAVERPVEVAPAWAVGSHSRPRR